MSDLVNIEITKETILYSADSNQKEVQYELEVGTLAHKDIPTVDYTPTFTNRFYVTVTEGKHKEKKGWIEDGKNNYITLNP